MKILHIVTLVTPDGSYGGPARVAFNLVREIADRGHEVILAATSRGYDPVPSTIYDIPVWLSKPRQLPSTGFVGIFSPALLWGMWRRRKDFDVVHVHMGRDMVSLPAAALAVLLKKRVVIQTHGMVDASDHPLAPLLDRMLTRPVLRHADAVLFLTDQERRDLLEVGGDITVRQLPNGVPMGDSVDRRYGSGGLEVLFLARLHARKRPRLFVEAAGELLAEGIDARFTLVGPDEGEGDNVTRAIADLGDRAPSVRWVGALPPNETVERMKRASIYCLPSVQEPFPMSVLEAMSVGLPVVMTASCGLANTISDTGSGIVIDESKEALVSGMRRLLLDASLREQMGKAAQETALRRFGMKAVGDALLQLYSGDGAIDRRHADV